VRTNFSEQHAGSPRNSVGSVRVSDKVRAGPVGSGRARVVEFSYNSAQYAHTVQLNSALLRVSAARDKPFFESTTADIGSVGGPAYIVVIPPQECGSVSRDQLRSLRSFSRTAARISELCLFVRVGIQHRVGRKLR